MRFANSIKLLIVNFKNTYKILLYNLVILLIGFAISMALIAPGLEPILKSTEMSELRSTIVGFGKAFVQADGEYLANYHEKLTTAVNAFLSLLRSKNTTILLLVAVGVFVYLLVRFLNTVCYFTIGGVLDERMTSYARSSFGDVLIRNLGRASIYSVVYVPIAFLWTVMTVAIGI